MARKKRIIRIKRVRASALMASLLTPAIETKGTESMETNRDAVHAAGGSFLAAQTSKATSADNAADKRSSRGPRAVPNMKEDFALTTWLHERTPTYGESFADVYAEALDYFRNQSLVEKLNVDHIRTRMEHFADSLPKAEAPIRPLTFEDRVARVEFIVSIMARQLLTGSTNQQDREFIAQYLNTVQLVQPN